MIEKNHKQLHEEDLSFKGRFKALDSKLESIRDGVKFDF